MNVSVRYCHNPSAKQSYHISLLLLLLLLRMIAQYGSAPCRPGRVADSRVAVVLTAPATTKIGRSRRKLEGNAIRFVILSMSCATNNGRVRVEMARTCAVAETELKGRLCK